MRNTHLIALTILVVGLMMVATGSAADKKTKGAKNADAWLGRDAGDLLLQLRVDGGRVEITEIESTGETAYTWSTWNDPYDEPVVVGSTETMIGMQPAGGGLAAFPIYRTDYIYGEPIHHPATKRCDVTFFADLEGIVNRWEYDGYQCDQDVKKPKK